MYSLLRKHLTDQSPLAKPYPRLVDVNDLSPFLQGHLMSRGRSSADSSTIDANVDATVSFDSLVNSSVD